MSPKPLVLSKTPLMCRVLRLSEEARKQVRQIVYAEYGDKVVPETDFDLDFFIARREEVVAPIPLNFNYLLWERWMRRMCRTISALDLSYHLATTDGWLHEVMTDLDKDGEALFRDLHPPKSILETGIEPIRVMEHFTTHFGVLLDRYNPDRSDYNLKYECDVTCDWSVVTEEEAKLGHYTVQLYFQHGVRKLTFNFRNWEE